jgi:hypothetical protein
MGRCIAVGPGNGRSVGREADLNAQLKAHKMHQHSTKIEWPVL